MEFLKQKIRKKVLEHRTKSTSTSPERGRAEREDDEAQATDAPGARGQSDPEVLKMDELDVMDRETVSRRRSVLTMLHLVLRLASLAQPRMNSYQEKLTP